MALVEGEAFTTQEQIEWTEDNQQKFGLAKVVTRVYPCRQQVLKRKQWKKFGKVKDTPRGTHHRGDFLLQHTMKIQTIEEVKQDIEFEKK